jgi:hypothetical protein
MAITAAVVLNGQDVDVTYDDVRKALGLVEGSTGSSAVDGSWISWKIGSR